MHPSVANGELQMARTTSPDGSLTGKQRCDLGKTFVFFSLHINIILQFVMCLGGGRIPAQGGEKENSDEGWNRSAVGDCRDWERGDRT